MSWPCDAQIMDKDAAIEEGRWRVLSFLGWFQAVVAKSMLVEDVGSTSRPVGINTHCNQKSEIRCAALRCVALEPGCGSLKSLALAPLPCSPHARNNWYWLALGWVLGAPALSCPLRFCVLGERSPNQHSLRQLQILPTFFPLTLGSAPSHCAFFSAVTIPLIDNHCTTSARIDRGLCCLFDLCSASRQDTAFLCSGETPLLSRLTSPVPPLQQPVHSMCDN